MLYDSGNVLLPMSEILVSATVSMYLFENTWSDAHASDSTAECIDSADSDFSAGVSDIDRPHVG